MQRGEQRRPACCLLPELCWLVATHPAARHCGRLLPTVRRVPTLWLIDTLHFSATHLPTTSSLGALLLRIVSPPTQHSPSKGLILTLRAARRSSTHLRPTASSSFLTLFPARAPGPRELPFSPSSPALAGSVTTARLANPHHRSLAAICSKERHQADSK